MRTFYLVSFCLILMVLLIAGAYSCGSLKPLDLVQALRDLTEAQSRIAELEAQHREALRSMEATRQVVREVIARRVTLLEAAVREPDLNAGRPDVPSGLRDACPGQTDDERLCGRVISCVENELEDQGRPDQIAGVVARLRAELDEHRERDGTVRLPEPRP